MADLEDLVSFNGSDGAHTEATLIVDVLGNLYGTTSSGHGTVFEITKPATDYSSTPTTLASFTGTDGLAPQRILSVRT